MYPHGSVAVSRCSSALGGGLASSHPFRSSERTIFRSALLASSAAAYRSNPEPAAGFHRPPSAQPLSPPTYAVRVAAPVNNFLPALRPTPSPPHRCDIPCLPPLPQSHRR